ncbi:hypothetical protein [Paenibacillus sp. FJAT-27812]|uniref:hypothetical protein n=1 Tax=Paenibacillus sp. FJAT-27812 TaxID=1684143 RepID=UPI0006A79279|nr:hypothetical protein [Paenibacillus sp. FJAT-27812]
MCKNLKYIGFYDDINNHEEKRNYFLAATNKMDYIMSALIRLGYEVNIISPSWTANNKGIYSKKERILKEGVTLTLGTTFGANNRVTKTLRILNSQIWLLIKLLFSTKKNEDILVYHSLSLIPTILLAKKIKKFNLILEVEEIYQDVKNYSGIIKKLEFMIFEKADKFLFSTEKLHEIINFKSKPHCIIYGTYQVEKERNSSFGDESIHIVYAGVIDTHKGGAMAAVCAAEYLSSKYHVHIIGFGDKKDIDMLKEKIVEINTRSKCKITYDGLFKGEEYIQFIQKCHIGLSTQTPNAKFTESSFPSKILSYLSNGLRVVSARLSSIENSSISNDIVYYENQNAIEIAQAIMSIDIHELIDSRKTITRLDEEFIVELNQLMKD